MNHETFTADQRLDEFESAWKAADPDAPPQWADYLVPQGHPRRRQQFLDLVHLDLRYRIVKQRRTDLLAPEYLSVPGVEWSDDERVTLVEHEYQTRWRFQVAAGSRDRYLDLFPDLAPLLTSNLRPRWTCRACSRTNVEDREDADPVTCRHCQKPMARASFARPGHIAGDGSAAGDLLPPGYEFVKELGRGGMGVVFQATQTNVGGRPVAVKMILKGDYASRDELDRFGREVEAAGRLRHPNIVQVYHFGEHRGRPFYSMEFCEKGSLEAELRTKPLTIQEAAGLVATLGEAVARVHDQGLIHRDLKPANVLIGAAGEPKIADFGLAKQLDRIGNTETGEQLGTPDYMSPEQARGERGIGPWSDVYSLGAILYACLTGRPPFSAASSQATLEQVLSDQDATPVRKLRPDTPRDLEAVCLKCLQKTQAARYPTAAALAADLRRYLDGRPTEARPVGSGVRLAKWVRRRPAQAALIASLATVGLLVVLGGSFYRLWHLAEESAFNEGKARERAEAAQGEAERLRDAEARERKRADTARDLLAIEQKKTLAALGREEEAVRREGGLRQQISRLNYTQAVNLAHREWGDNNIERALALLRDCPEDLRNWEWGYVERLCRAGRQTLRGHTAPILKVDVSPDGRHAASCGADGTVVVWDLAAGKELVRPEVGKAKITDVRFVDKGASLFGIDDQRRGTVRWDATTGKVQQRAEPKATSEPLAYSGRRYGPGGRYYLTAVAPAGGRPGPLKIWDAQGDREVSTLNGLPSALMAVAFNADGRRVLGAGFDGTAIIWWTGDGQEVVRLKNTYRGIITAALTERYAVLGFDEGTVSVWDVETGAEVMTAKPHAGRITGIQFTRQGDLVTSSIDGAIKVTDIRRGREVKSFNGHVGAVYGIAISPDGRRLVSGGADKVVAVWDVEAPQDAQSFNAHRAWQVRAAISPDSRVMATSSIDRTVKVWDLSSNTLLHTFRHPEEGFNGVIFARDGKSVFAACVDGTVKQWELPGGKQLATYGTMPLAATSLALNPDGRQLLAGGADGTIQIWEVGSAKKVDVIRTNCGVVRSLGYSPDGRRLAAAGQRVQWWTNGDTRATEADWRPSGKATVRADEVGGVAFSPSGEEIYGSVSDGTVRVWDAVSGVERRVLRGHRGRVSGLALSPDGQRLATVSEDSLVKVWDTSTAQEILTLKGHATQVESVVFSPDGHSIASGSMDGVVRIWKSK